MRRSAAPSVVQSSRRPRFQPPFAPQRTTDGKQILTEEEKPRTQKVSELQQVLKGIRRPIRTFSASESGPGSAPTSIHSEQVPSTLTGVQSIVYRDLSDCSSDSISLMSEDCSSTSQPTIPISSEVRDSCASPSVTASVPNVNLGSGVHGTTPAARMGYKVPHKSGFCPPAKKRRPNEPVGTSSTSKSCADEEVKSNASSSDADCKYYSVMWCKMSKKKHKTWEGDAILITKGRTALLKDMEGKDIGKGTGYKPSELVNMKDGSTLIIGGKEIEVMGEVSAEDWKSGKCFTGALADSTSSSVPEVRPVKHYKKGFSKVSGSCATGSATVTNSPATVKVEPLYNPAGLDALVMPRPSQRHQLQHNHRGLPVVDVVVDPHLSSHLRPHQREGVRFLYECAMGLRDFSGNGAILADEMGLGKTLQCIATLWTLIKQGPYGRKPVVKRAIVVTPGSLVKNWEREFTKWLGNERLRVFAVTSDNRVEEFIHSPIYPVLIISYEMFLRSHHILKGVSFDLIICDEGHRLKNAGAKTTSLIMGLSVQRRIVLTGTPIQNDLHEFYSIVEFCNPGILGSHAAFQRVYEDPIVLSRQPSASPEEKEIGETRANELKRLTSLFCLRRTQEINNKYLPPKVESVVFCKMAPLQLTLYQHLLRSGLVQACLRRNSSFSPHLVCIGALKKLCNCPSLIHSASAEVKEGEGSSENIDEVDPSLYTGVLPLYPSGYDPLTCCMENSGKLTVLSKMLEYLHTNTREKIVVVSNYTQTLNLLQRMCEMAGYRFLRLDGSTPAAKRQPLVERFNSKHCTESVFLLSSKAGGVGLNLIGASRLVLYDIDWNPANDLQAMARVWRDGQKRRVHIYRLLTTGSIEEKIYQRQICKQGLNTVVDVKDNCDSGSVQFSLEDLKDLFSLRDNTLCDTHDLLECDCSCETMERSSGTTGLRHCQLGLSGSSKNTAMNELLDWKHFSHPIEQSELQDELLHWAASCITFVFQSEANSSNSLE